MTDTSTGCPKKGPTDDTIRLGICPALELDPHYALPDAMDKGTRYAALLRLAYPGARIAVMHDVDSRRPESLTVCLLYDTDDPAQVAQSYEIEDTLPTTWAELERMAEEQDERRRS